MGLVARRTLTPTVQRSIRGGGACVEVSRITRGGLWNTRDATRSAPSMTPTVHCCLRRHGARMPSSGGQRYEPNALPTGFRVRRDGGNRGRAQAAYEAGDDDEPNRSVFHGTRAAARSRESSYEILQGPQRVDRCPVRSRSSARRRPKANVEKFTSSSRSKASESSDGTLRRNGVAHSRTRMSPARRP